MRFSIRIVLAALLSMQWIFVSSAAYAQMSAAKIISPAAEAVAKKLNVTKFYQVASKEVPMGSVGADIVNAEGKVVSQLIVPASAKKENVISTLRKFSNLAVGTAIRFPPEAFTFFLAIGALNISHLVFDYADNPVLLQQHFMSQNPTTWDGAVGHLGFYAFMMANHATNAHMQTILNPNGRMIKFAPYLGMSAGLMASNIVHELAHFGDLKKCVENIRNRVAEAEKFASCEKAYDSWTEVGFDKLEQYSPSLLSMATAVFTSGLIEQYAIRKAIIALGWEVILTATPAGWTVRGARWIYQIAQIVLMTQFQMMQEKFLNVPFKNMVDGNSLDSQERKILDQLNSKRKNGWKASNQEEDLDLTLRKFSEMTYQWRQFNMEKTLISHASWQQYLHSLTSTYQASYDFYTNFTGEYYKRNVEKKKDSWLDRPLLLAGVKPNKPQIEGAKLDLLGNPEDFEFRQIETLIDIRKRYENALLKTNFYKQYISTETERQKILQVLSYLPTEADWNQNTLDYPRIATGLDLLNSQLGISTRYPGLYPVLSKPSPLASKDYRAVLLAIRNEIGEAYPLRDAGLGYLYAYQRDSRYQGLLSQLDVPHYNDRLRYFQPVQYLVGQMLYGPNADQQSLVRSNRDGWPARFLPPRLVPAQKYSYQNPISQTQTPGIQPASLFNVPVDVSSNSGQQRYSNFFEILRNGPLLPSIFGDGKEQSMQAWWTAKVEKQYIQAWQKYEDEYQRIAVETLETMRATSRHPLNLGPMANGIEASARQERRLYLLILGELLKSQASGLSDKSLLALGSKNRNVRNAGLPLKTPLTNRLAAQDQINCTPNNKACNDLINIEMPTLVPVLRTLEVSDSMNLSKIYSAYQNKDKALSLDGSEKIAQNYLFQDQIEEQFESLESLLHQLQIQTVSAGKGVVMTDMGPAEFDMTTKVVMGPIKNKQITELQKKIDESITKLESQLIEKVAGADKFKTDLIKACTEGLRRLSQHEGDLGKIVNSVSYIRSEDGSDDKSRQASTCSDRPTTSRKDAFGKTVVMKSCAPEGGLKQSAAAQAGH